MFCDSEIIYTYDSTQTERLNTYLPTGGIDKLLAIDKRNYISSKEVIYTQTDNLSSVEEGFDKTGTTKFKTEYSAFGEIINDTDTENDKLISYSGKLYDKDPELYYFGARWYDPSSGRWLTPDPLGFVDGMNLYAFVGNNPVNFVDPMGLCQQEINDAWWQGLWQGYQENVYNDITGTSPYSPIGFAVNRLSNSNVLWGQVGSGTANIVGGSYTAVLTGSAMVNSTGLGAVIFLAPFMEGLVTAGYGVQEVVAALNGSNTPDLVTETVPKIWKNFAAGLKISFPKRGSK